MRSSRAALGRSLRTLRETAGLDPAQLAALAGTSPEFVAAVEEGRSRPSRAWVVSVTLAVAAHLQDGGGRERP